jgi:glycine cleavage system aminomethyltransferase T
VLPAIDTDIDAVTGSKPVYSNGRVVGECASVSYGHRCEKNLALAYINVDALAADDLQVRIIGGYLSASVTKVCIHDSEGEKLMTYLSK